MKLFSVRGAEITVSPLLLAVIPLAVIFGRARFLLIAFISLAAHEVSHAVFAHRLGCEVDSIEIQPFGFTARIDTQRAAPAELAAVYAAGPFASLLMASFCSLLCGVSPDFGGAVPGIAEYNLLICAVNLLPALPLDGGRLIYAAVCGRGRRLASKLLRASGVFTGAAFVTVFALLLARGFINPTFGIMGAFLIAAALREREDAALPRLHHRRISGGGCLPVQQIAVSHRASISEALLMLPPGKYSVVGVLDDGGRITANLDEARLVEAASRLGAYSSLDEAVAIFSRTVV